MFIRYCRVPVPVTVPARTLPYLIYSLLIYLPTVCRNHLSREPFIHSFIHPLPPSLPPGCRLGIYVCICTYVSVRPCISVYLSVCMYIHTYIQYPQKVHIKGTYQRYMYTCVLGYVVVSYFKNIFADPIDTKNHPTNVRAPALSFTTSLGEFMCKPKQIFPFKLAPENDSVPS